MGQEQDYVRGQGEAHVVQIRKALAAIGLLFPLVLTLGLTPAHAESVPEPEPNVEVSSDSSEQVADPAQESAEDQTREEIEVPGPANPEDQESYPEVETPDHSGDTEEPDLSLDPKNANENKGPYRAPQITSWSTGGATFQPGYIISDQNMYNSDAMTAAQVQSFLNQRVPRCTIGDPGRAAGSKPESTDVSAAQLVSRARQHC